MLQSTLWPKRLYRFRVNGNTIERSDVSLTTPPRAAPIGNVAVFEESTQGKTIAAEVWHGRNICQNHLHEAVCKPKDKANITISFDRAG